MSYWWNLSGTARLTAEFEHDINDTFEHWEKLCALKKDFQKFMSLFPDELFDKVKELEGSYASRWDKKGLIISIPWDLGALKDFENILTAKNFTKNRERNEEKSTTIYYRSKDFDDEWEVTICMDATRSGSKCILVPIAWETVTITKAKALDKVCPETHPELFEDNPETGELEYIGDALFPKPPEGIKI